MKTNHLLSDLQIAVIHGILKKFDIENKKPNRIIGFDDIEVLGSDFTDEIFVRYVRYFIGDDQNAAKSNECIGIAWNGIIDYEVYKRKFKDLSDKVHFFDKLFNIEIK